MLSAGKAALLKAMPRFGVTDPAVVFTCSCALRSGILGEPAGEEISRMKDMLPGVPLVGFYSFGEYGTTIDGVGRVNIHLRSGAQGQLVDISDRPHPFPPRKRMVTGPLQYLSDYSSVAGA